MPRTTSGKAPRVAKVFIVEDHPVYREGLAQILNQEENLTVCGTAGSASEALQAIADLQPDVVLIDITLPGKSGLELIKDLRASNRMVKLLVVSMHDEALYADRVLRAGGNGYIMKQEDPAEIISAIQDVLAGHVYLSEEVLAGANNGSAKRRANTKARRLDRLTDSELEILEMLGQGKSSRDIACHLRLSARDVAAQCSRIQKRLSLKTADALIRYAVCWVETGAE